MKRIACCLRLFAFVAVASLPAAAGTISGQVTNELGQPMANVDLDFIDIGLDDEFKPDNGDITDLNGNYVVVAPPGVYDVFFIPPVGPMVAGHVAASVNLNVNQTVNVTLPDAWFVTGRVFRGDNGQPAVGIDLDFDDLASGLKIYTPRDNTDAFGVYNVLVPKGIYEVSYDGPQPDLPTDPPQLAHGFFDGEVSIDGSGATVELPDVTLPLGFHIEGLVRDSQADAIAGADLDLFLAGTETELFTKNDNTNPSGFYDTIVPAGTYDIEIDPPAGTIAVAKVRTGVVVTGDMVVGIDTLDEGRSVSGNVFDSLGGPVSQVDLDAFTTAGGTPVPTFADETDASGHYSIRLSPGTYDLEYDPMINRQVDPVTTFGVGVLFDMVLADVILPLVDTDGDGTSDRLDDCPFAADAFHSDGDFDGVGDPCDNCPTVANARQEDNDLDRLGDACDPDDDNDGLVDGIDGDRDGDGVADASDNCPQAANPGQEDTVVDGVGDACDPDDGEVEYLEARAPNSFAWRAETGATAYQVYRQQLEWLSNVNYGVCIHDVPDGTSLVDEDLPLDGQVFTYLVTARMLAGEGAMGRSGSGALRPNLRPCP